MTFFSLKCAVFGLTLGAAVSTCGYLLSTASYVGSTSGLVLAPKTTDAGTMWIAENDEIAVEVRYISSVIETPVISIRKKQQWRKLAICMISGILLAYISYRLMMRKAKATEPEPSIEILPEPTTPIETPPTDSP
jgi:hypothetical protein